MSLPPCPHLTIVLELPADPDAAPDLAQLPARPGVFALEDVDGHTLCLATTANVRRLVRSRLAAPPARSRRIDYRETTRRVRAVSVGSTFEADWVYLQQARLRFPRTYAALLDRWRAWFLHCDPGARFPRFTRMSLPGRLPAGGVVLGPVRDRQAGQRYVELLEQVFDLCRYHHVLVQAPHGAACAYKDMGRCPAPCDGSIGLGAYRAQIDAAIGFAAGGGERWRREVDAAMRDASAGLDFETAERHRRRLAEAGPATGEAFVRLDRLERFRWLALMPCERPAWQRVFVVAGGWIAPVADVPIDGEPSVLERLARAGAELPLDCTSAALENIGLVSHHLYHARAGRFIRIPAPDEPFQLPPAPDETPEAEVPDSSLEV